MQLLGSVDVDAQIRIAFPGRISNEKEDEDRKELKGSCTYFPGCYLGILANQRGTACQAILSNLEATSSVILSPSVFVDMSLISMVHNQRMIPGSMSPVLHAL